MVLGRHLLLAGVTARVTPCGGPGEDPVPARGGATPLHHLQHCLCVLDGGGVGERTVHALLAALVGLPGLQAVAAVHAGAQLALVPARLGAAPAVARDAGVGVRDPGHSDPLPLPRRALDVLPVQALGSCSATQQEQEQEHGHPALSTPSLGTGFWSEDFSSPSGISTCLHIDSH